MDRYFELDQLARRIGEAIAKLYPRVTLVLNADDPIVAWLGQRHRGPVLYFGVDDPEVGGRVPQAISDATRCPRCGQPLRYERVVLAHEGDWSCPSCALARPERDVAATRVALTAVSSEIVLRTAVASAFVRSAFRSRALQRVQRAGAMAVGVHWTSPADRCARDRELQARVRPPGRGDSRGRELAPHHGEDPAGFNAAIGALLETGRRPHLLAALNDRDADSRDVSWIWDADFEALAPAIEHAVVTGIRSRDLANRLKYAGVPRDKVEVVDQWGSATDRAIGTAPQGAEIVVLATYTAMLALRNELARRGLVANFWED